MGRLRITFSTAHSGVGCVPLRCGLNSEQQDYAIVYWLDTAVYANPADAPGFNNDKILLPVSLTMSLVI